MRIHGIGARAATALALLLAACGGGSGGSGGSGGGSLGAPASLVALPGPVQVALSWSHVSGASSYTLYWSTTPGVTPATGTPIAGVSSPHVHGPLASGTTYYYVVTASNGSGEGPPSAPEQSAVPQGAGVVFNPPWAQVAPTQTFQINYDQTKSSPQNGTLLKNAIQSLPPGARLEIGSGTYTIDAFFTINRVGTALAPIWIAAKAGATPVITRSDAMQNTINVGSGGPTRYLALQGLEITGGDTALRLWDCQNVWVDSCYIHDCAGVGIEGNSDDTGWLYITRNEIHGTAGTGEGIYLGGNNGTVITHDSLVALNHVHHTGGSQGDGIELKQGSYNTSIIANLVHDTPYPGILVYGTGGGLPNLIERNTVYNSGDNVMQVQGEAIVQNNLLMNGNAAFASHDHQGQVRDLTVVHNTLINTGRAADLSDWSGKPNMTFANNVCYSKTGDAVRFNGGSAGVEFVGNAVFGPVVGVIGGFVNGTGLLDFEDVTWTATKKDARPVPLGALIGTGDFVWALPIDITGAARQDPLEAGCFDGP